MEENQNIGDPLQDLYNEFNSKLKLAKDYNEFKSVMQDPSNRKAFFDEFNPKLKLAKDYDEFDSVLGLKKKELSLPSGEVSSLSELPSEFIAPLKKGISPNQAKEEKLNQLPIIDDGTHKTGPSQVVGGMTIPTNLPKQEQLKYENKLKVDDAAVNTLIDIYNKKGLKFDPSKPAAQKQIQEYIDKEKNNDLVRVTGKDGKEYLTRGQGFGEATLRTFGRSLKDPFESSQINFTNNPSELADLLDEKAAEEPNVPESAPSKFGGYLGGLVGGLPKMAALLAIPYAGESAMVIEMYHNAMANQRKELYQRGLDQGMSREQAAKKAMETAPTTAIPDAVLGYAMAKGVGTRGAKNILPETAKKSFIDAAGKLTKEVGAMSGMGFAGETGRGILTKQAGYDITKDEILQRGLSGASEWGLMHAAFKLMHVAPKAIVSAAKNLLSHVPEPILKAESENYPDGEQTLAEVGKFANTKTKVADFVPENKVAAVTGLTEKTDNLKKDIEALEQNKKVVPPSVAVEIDNQIKDKNKEVEFYDKQIKKVIDSKSETGIDEEVDDITGKKIGTKTYIVDGKEVSQSEFEAMQGKPSGTKTVVEPTEIGGLKVIKRAQDAPNGEAVYEVEGERFLTADGKELKVAKVELPKENAQSKIENIAKDLSKDEFLSNTHVLPLEGLDPEFSEATKAKVLSRKSRNPEAPIRLGFRDGKVTILDGAHRYYEAIERGDKTIKANFAYGEGADKFYDKVKEVKPTEVKALGEEYNNKSVDELIALKKKLYPSPDIESPMTPDEKLLDRVIAKKFSEKQQEIVSKRKSAGIGKENERAKYLGFDTDAKDTLNDINDVLNENYENLYEVNSVTAYKAKKLINQSNKIKEKVVVPELKNITAKNIEDKLRYIEFEVTHAENGKDIHHGSDVTETGSKIIRNDIEYPTYVITGRNENNYFDFIINNNGDIEPVSGYDISDIKVRQFPKSEMDVKDTAKKLQDIADSRERKGKIDEKTFQLYKDAEKLVGGRNGFDYTKNKWEDVAKFYHKALKDGSNPELVKMVGDYLEGTYTPKEPKVYNAKDLKKNPEILKEDEDNNTITYPRSFVRLATNMLALKSAGHENAKIGDVINIFKKDYVIEDFSENKKNPNETKVGLIRVDKDGNILRERDLSKKEQKEGKAKEFEEEEEEVEPDQITKDDLKKAEAKFAAAEDKFKKARNKIEATQVKQAGMFGGEQKGMFAMGGEEAKNTLDPLRKATKEAKAELDDIRNKIKVQEQAQPELTPVEKGRTPQVKPLSEFKVGDKFVFATDSGGSEQTIVSIDNGIVTFKRKGSKEPSSASEIQRLGNDLALLKSDWDKGIRPNKIEYEGSRFQSRAKPTEKQISNLTKELLRVNYTGADLKAKSEGTPGKAGYVQSAEDWYREIAKRYLENDISTVEVVDDLHGGKERVQSIINGEEVPKKTYQEVLKEKQQEEKKRNREIGAEKATKTKEVFRKLSQTDRQLGTGEIGAQEIALRYLADGGKVSEDAINEAYGTRKTAELNTGRKEVRTTEARARDYAEGKETLDGLAHRLWEANDQRVPEDLIKDALMAEIGGSNTRLDAAEAYLDNYNEEYKAEKYYARIEEDYEAEHLAAQEQLEKELRGELDKQIEGLSSEEHINNLIDQYETETKGENQQPRAEGEGEVNKEISGRNGGEKVKVEEKGIEDVPKNEKRKKINAKFEELLNQENLYKKFKIKSKCL